MRPAPRPGPRARLGHHASAPGRGTPIPREAGAAGRGPGLGAGSVRAPPAPQLRLLGSPAGSLAAPTSGPGQLLEPEPWGGPRPRRASTCATRAAPREAARALGARRRADGARPGPISARRRRARALPPPPAERPPSRGPGHAHSPASRATRASDPRGPEAGGSRAVPGGYFRGVGSTPDPASCSPLGASSPSPAPSPPPHPVRNNAPLLLSSPRLLARLLAVQAAARPQGPVPRPLPRRPGGPGGGRGGVGGRGRRMQLWSGPG